MHHPRRRNVTTSVVRSEKVTHAKISPEKVNPRDVAGNAEEEEEEEEEEKVEEEEEEEEEIELADHTSFLPHTTVVY